MAEGENEVMKNTWTGFRRLFIDSTFPRFHKLAVFGHHALAYCFVHLELYVGLKAEEPVWP